MKNICLFPVIPVRAEASDRAEMVTQMLFGESCEILDDKQIDNFIKIKMDFDGYEGWVDNKQIGQSDDEHKLIVTDNEYFLEEAILPFGALVPDEERTNQYTPHSITEVAEKYLNTAYLWGGKSNFGIDCSGFTQQVLKICGINILRDAYQQATQGKEVQFEDLQPGDLAFYGNERVTHVSIILENNQAIHAHGFVRISSYNNEGLLTDDEQNHTHKAICYRRFS